MPYKDREKARASARKSAAKRRAKIREYQREWQAKNPDYSKLNQRKWRRANPERAAYQSQRSAAMQRSIPWLLAFEEWRAIWQASGKWKQMGRRKGQYVMARFRDTGPYAVGNVRICTTEENNGERQISLAGRSAISRKSRGRNHSDETRRKQSEARKRYWLKRHDTKAL